MPPQRKARQRSLRKTRAASDEEDEQGAEQSLSVTQAADIIAARKQKKKEARRHALLGGNTSGGVSNATASASVDIMAGRTTDEYSSIAKMNAMAKELNVKISGSFRKEEDRADDGRVSMGFSPEDMDPGRGSGHDGAILITEMDDGVENDASYAIPDEETIRKARQKRELLRYGAGTGDADHAPDFIPTGNGGRGEQYKHVSFKDDLDVRKFDRELDRELDESAFAREQIEKGMRTVSVGGRAGNQSRIQNALDLKSLDATVLADDILNKLISQLERVDMTLKQHEHGIARTRENLADATKRVVEDEKVLHDLSDGFMKAQEMRGYVRTLCSMLHEKSPILEELQHQSLLSLTERAHAESGAATLKAKELLISASKGVEAATQALLGGGSEADAVLAASQAVTEADDRLKRGDHIPVELDEFGRDMNMEKRLLARSGTSSVADAVGKADRAFWTRHEEIRRELECVFADTDERFASLAVVRDRLESWKADHRDQYDVTFMGLSAPALFAPFVRLELIQWNALDPGSASFTEQHWYSMLFDYGAQSPDSDPDHRVIPSLVIQLVLPWVTDLARDVWNLDVVDLDEALAPSTSAVNQSRALSASIADIMVYCDRENSASYKPVGALVDVVTHRLRTAISSFVAETPSWMPSAISATHRAQECRDAMLRRGTTLLSCVCAFRGVLLPPDVDALVEPLGKGIVQLLRTCIASPHACASVATLVCDALNGYHSGGTGGTGAIGSLLVGVRDILTAVSAQDESSRVVSAALTRINAFL